MSIIKRLGQRLFPYDDGTLPGEVARNLRIMVISVLISQFCFSTTGGSAFTGYIKALGATDFMLGLLMAMPYCVRVLQLFASYILERTGKRKFLMCALGLFSRLLWVPIGLVPLFIPMEMAALRLWGILVLYVLSAMGGTFIDTCFFSLCADVVPMRIRGRFFTMRSRVAVIISIGTGLLASWMLDTISGYNGLLGYMVCFVLAGISGAGDIFCFLFMRFPKMEDAEGENAPKRRSLPSMIGDVFRNRPFMKLVAYWTVWSFSVNIMAPYFNVYMLEHLGMSFMQITLLCTVPANIFSFLLLTRWGRMMDGYGYKCVIYICATVGGFLPFVWMLSGPSNFAVTVLLANALTGAVWTAIDLSAQNTIMNAAPARNRSMYTAVYIMLSQLCGIALGFITGGFLLDTFFVPLADAAAASGFTLLGLPVTQYHFLMALSAILRLTSVHGFLRIARLDAGVSTLKVIGEIAENTKKSARRNWAVFRAQILRKKARRRERNEEHEEHE